jgi:hypothetical protein
MTFSIRRATAAMALAGLAVGLALALVSSSESSIGGNGLYAFVQTTNRGPLPVCTVDCATKSTTWQFIHVVNANELTTSNGAASRATLANSFVVTRVDMRVFVDGVQYGGTTTFLPPPNIQPDFLLNYAGHWPATVTCGGNPPPCGIVGNPAVLPTEAAIPFYTGWLHAAGELNGSYVFRFTVHGTLNGAPADVDAVSQAITMTG